MGEFTLLACLMRFGRPPPPSSANTIPVAEPFPFFPRQVGCGHAHSYRPKRCRSFCFRRGVGYATSRPPALPHAPMMKAVSPSRFYRPGLRDRRHMTGQFAHIGIEILSDFAYPIGSTCSNRPSVAGRSEPLLIIHAQFQAADAWPVSGHLPWLLAPGFHIPSSVDRDAGCRGAGDGGYRAAAVGVEGTGSGEEIEPSVPH